MKEMKEFDHEDDKNIDKLAENTVVIAVNLTDNNTIHSPHANQTSGYPPQANQNSGHPHPAEYKSHPSDHNTGHPNITEYKTENNYHHLDPLSTQVSYPSNDGDHQSGSELNRNSSHISYSANDTRDGLAKGKKLGHRREKDGEVTYKKFETTQLMGSIQLGIQNSVGNLNEEDRDLLHADFYTIETVFFSRDGSQHKTPAHNYSNFKFRTYAPLAFRKFRDIFEIDREKFLVSVCAQPMVELSNPGASGSIFYITQDDEIICKTVSHKESRFLQEILPAYYLNLHQNFRTLLPKFFGFYCYSCNTKNVRITAMKNLLPSALEIHHKFDLKGSTFGRKADKKERRKAKPTFKDLDFKEMYPDGIFLHPDIYNALMDTIERDCRALESLRIMDYSLLLGIHFCKDSKMASCVGGGESIVGYSDDPAAGGSSGAEDSENGDGYSSRRNYPPPLELKQRLVAHSTPLESITADMDDHYSMDGTSEQADKISTWGGIPAKTKNGENLLIFLGIIDILQSYGVTKKLEHTLKSFIYDGDTVSVHRPSFYASRFKTFMSESVFKKPPPPLKPTTSVRRSLSKRISRNKDEEVVKAPVRSDVPTRRTQSTGEPPAVGSGAVTVITIGSDTDEAGGILPSVLRDKPRITSTPGKAMTSPTATTAPLLQQQQIHSTGTDHPPPTQRPFIPYSRPDVADVVAVSCTPPPDIGGVTSGDERVQIYVPSPQTTPYSTIGKHDGRESHRSGVMLLNYTRHQESISSVALSPNQVDSRKTVSELKESFLAHTEVSMTTSEVTQGEPVSISQVYIEMKADQQ